MSLKVFVNVVCSVCFASMALAQGVQTGTLRGVVQDEQGLPVPSATVKIASPAVQAGRTVVTEGDGRFVFRALPPGDYAITVNRASFTPASAIATVPLGLDVETNVTLKVGGTQDSVQVNAESPTPIASPVAGMNIRHNDVEQLAVSRSLSGIAELSPGLTNITPNKDQVSINGAFAFDNSFMVNGVDIADNLLGSPLTLFVEDAVQEVQTLTSGIPAEFGRFSGGVVNAITRSGSNVFSGSFRSNFSNPSWSTVTPFEASHGVTHDDQLNKSYEATLGGPIVVNRLWFFGSTRLEDTAVAQAFPQTGIANTETDRNRRGEIKLTATVAPNHTVQGGYMNNATTYINRPSLPGFSIDPSTIADASVPNWYAFTNYHGVLGASTLAEAQYAQRRWTRIAGGTSTSPVDSPFIALSVPAQYNAPYFDASDPEERNSFQLTGSLTHFLNRRGRHELKSGYEWFRSQRTGGNAQSATDLVFHADYLTDAAGTPMTDSTGHLVPLFMPGETLVETFTPIRNAVLNVDTQSVYGQDHWTINARWSADLGLRFEKVRSVATGGIVGVDTHTLVPRLAAAYDIKGNGQYVAHVTYGHYAGRYDENQIGANSNVGNPDETIGVYVGPAGQGRSFNAGFDPANYLTVAGLFPTANVQMAPGLSTPITKEFTASIGAGVSRRGYVEGTYVFRRTTNPIEDSIALSNGVTDVVRDGVDFGTFTNIVYENSDVAIRKYQGMLFQARYTIRPNWTVNGHYTLMLQDDGNYEGEAPNQPGLTSQIGNYPEALNAARSFPMGRLQNFQRHKLRVWTVYTLDSHSYGELSFSGLWRANSGQVYSLAATGQPLSATQVNLIAAYPDQPSSQTIFFGPRGSETFAGYGVVDVSVNYAVPVFRSLRPWAKLDVFNLLDNQKQIAWNTTVVPDPNSPTDALGLATGFVPGPNFGKATSNTQFPAPFPGATGGRTIRFALGFRF
jgi:hypothetical protein